MMPTLTAKLPFVHLDCMARGVPMCRKHQQVEMAMTTFDSSRLLAGIEEVRHGRDANAPSGLLVSSSALHVIEFPLQYWPLRRLLCCSHCRLICGAACLPEQQGLDSGRWCGSGLQSLMRAAATDCIASAASWTSAQGQPSTSALQALHLHAHHDSALP